MGQEKEKRKKKPGAFLENSVKKSQLGLGPIDYYTHKAQIELKAQLHKAQSEWAPEESKAQLKWAPATSKDGSDYDPPSPVRHS
jgi:hypothetical protein